MSPVICVGSLPFRPSRGRTGQAPPQTAAARPGAPGPRPARPAHPARRTPRAAPPPEAAEPAPAVATAILPGQRFPEVLRDGDRLPGGVDRAAGDLPLGGEDVLSLHRPEQGEPEGRPLLLDPDDPGTQGEQVVETDGGPVPALGGDHGEPEAPPDVPVDPVGGKSPGTGV